MDNFKKIMDCDHCPYYDPVNNLCRSINCPYYSSYWTEITSSSGEPVKVKARQNEGLQND